MDAHHAARCHMEGAVRTGSGALRAFVERWRPSGKTHGPQQECIENQLGGPSLLPQRAQRADREPVQLQGRRTLLTSEAFGFCVLLPADFSYEEPSATNANLFIGSMMDVQHPKLMIEVTDAGGRTAAEAADALLAEFPADMGIQRTFGDMLGYEVAERLDGVPGQDLGRVLLAVHDDKLYRLTFVPADPAQSEVYTQMEELFNMVLQTWRFLPEE